MAHQPLLTCVTLWGVLLGGWLSGIDAYRDPCHRHHSCPSDNITYDRGPRRHLVRQPWSVIGWLPLLWLTACIASQTEGPTAVRASARTPGSERPALDRLLTPGDIQIAETRLQGFGFDPGPVDGIFTAQTQAAVRGFQARYGLPVSGLLDRATREELQLGVDPKRTS
jgi:Putative peptidoglycan binding domain